MPSRRSDIHEQAFVIYAEWEWNYSQVEAFVRVRGHCNLGEHPAGDWLRQQLQASTAGKLSPERQQRLASLGVSLDPGDGAWEAMLQRVRDVLIRRRVPRKKGREKWLPEPLDGDLAAWLREQRALDKARLLHPDRRSKLLGLKLLVVKRMPDPPPEPSRGSILAAEARERRHAALWESRHAELVAYKQEHGDCDVPKDWPENKPLANWVRFQRKLDHLGRMTEAHRSRLDALDFVWRLRSLPVDRRWERRFQELVQYKEAHGHTRVPKSFDWQLWHWRHVQRDFRRKGIMNPVRIARLDAIGFEWDEHGKPWAKSREDRWERQWDAMYAQLVEFQRQHGTTHVVAGWPENPRLATWVGDQREREHHGGLRPDRKARLEAISFVWNPGRPTLVAKWEERYAQLFVFKEQHGHTRVPKGFDRQLWRWRHVQREFRKKNMVSAERIERLDSIGFEWEGRDPA